MSALQPAMAAFDLFDFKAEYERVKHNLTLFEDVIAKKKGLESVTKSIELHFC